MYICILYKWINWNWEGLNGFGHMLFLLHCCYTYKFCRINFFFAEKIILHFLNIITTKLSSNISLCRSSKWEFFSLFCLMLLMWKPFFCARISSEYTCFILACWVPSQIVETCNYRIRVLWYWFISCCLLSEGLSAFSCMNASSQTLECC